jgi:hypothetical protein
VITASSTTRNRRWRMIEKVTGSMVGPFVMLAP